MKKGSSESTRNSEKTTRRRRKYDEEFMPQAAGDEIEQLRRRLKQVEMERDILKKALSIFSRQT